LQNYNNELVKCIDDLREKREEVNRQILAAEEEKAKIQKDLSILTERLQKINENLVRKTQARNEYDKTIQETEAAYMKVRVRTGGRACWCSCWWPACRLACVVGCGGGVVHRVTVVAGG
jgi:Sjoegren syndrome nuclear autoantigen 1